MTKYIILALISIDVIFNVTGQLLLKQGMSRMGNFSLSLEGVLPVFLRAATSIYILMGLVCYVTGFMIWLIVLSKAEVSYAYPLISMGYVLTAVMAWILFGENVTLMRMAGILITCLGVIIIARS